MAPKSGKGKTNKAKTEKKKKEEKGHILYLTSRILKTNIIFLCLFFFFFNETCFT
jgi:hypothetical protein